MKNNKIIFCVNGTLMKGFDLHKNLVNVNAKFIALTKTSPKYILYSIDDQNPAMLRTLGQNGASIEVELYEISYDGLMAVLKNEPNGLCLGKIELIDGSYVFGILGEPFIVENKKNITEYKGWRNYINALHK